MLEIFAVVDDDVGKGFLGIDGELHGEGFFSLRAGEPVSIHQSLGLDFTGNVDEDNGLEVTIPLSFEKQGDIE